MDLSIIILSFNTKELTLSCINSIVDQYREKLDKGQFEIIVVDNASTDGSQEMLKRLELKTQNFKFIQSKENLGFSKGNNLAAKKAKGEYLLFINSDTEIKDQGLLKMIDYLRKNEKVGILGGKLKNPDGTDQPSSGKFYNILNLFFWLLGSERLGFLKDSPREIKKVDWVSGASMMIRRNLFEKINGFEEKLFMYFEDLEICFKAQKKGFSTYFYPELILFHKERGSSNRTFAILHIYRGVLFFYKKYKPGWEYSLAKITLFVKAYLLNTIGKITNNKYYIETYGQALELF